MITRNVRTSVSAILLLTASVSILSVAGCGEDDGVVRGAGSIDVPKPTTYYSPQEAAAHQTGSVDAPTGDE